MKNKLIVTSLASLALLGPTLALASAECPAFLNSEEGVPCFVTTSNAESTEASGKNKDTKMAKAEEKHKANVDAFQRMVQNER